MPKLFNIRNTELAIRLQENGMFELAENTGSLDQVTQYELVLNHCSEKLSVNDKRRHHADAFTAAIDYA